MLGNAETARTICARSRAIFQEFGQVNRLIDLGLYAARVEMLSDDPEESFRTYQGLIKSAYDVVVDEFGLVRMDATQNLIRQQQQMRQLLEPHLDGVMRLDGQSLSDALVKAGLRGRYVERQEVGSINASRGFL